MGDLMKQFLTSSIEQNIIDAQDKICQNAGIPNAKGTIKWSDINIDLNGLYYISSPRGGWGGITFEQLMTDVVNVQEVDESKLSISQGGE